ncbi:unnamed protein product [Rangifer tarandus platyrhynchus]|uniref:Uncharacterized protein n=1 Tax=Rangifer tarandus platyrhynchus TaxID=3082113 RepID=A0ABN8XP04_RANTA|nr:unnamed protein product [Rangifer tarandus platyrhynchus]
MCFTGKFLEVRKKARFVNWKPALGPPYYESVLYSPVGNLPLRHTAFVNNVGRVALPPRCCTFVRHLLQRSGTRKEHRQLHWFNFLKELSPLR